MNPFLDCVYLQRQYIITKFGSLLSYSYIGTDHQPFISCRCWQANGVCISFVAVSSVQVLNLKNFKTFPAHYRDIYKCLPHHSNTYLY